MKNILKKVSIILLGCMLVMNVGCARKGSKAWVEKKVENMEKVYPTENIEDLFEKFPDGFLIRQIRLKVGDNEYESRFCFFHYTVLLHLMLIPHYLN